MATILYIEDDPIQRTILAEMLTLHGFEIEEAEDGQVGVEKVVSLLPDLVVTDSRMPRLNGFEVIEVIRKTPATAHIPVIALSAWLDNRYRKQALQAGADAAFTKPIDPTKLVTIINKLLAKE